MGGLRGMSRQVIGWMTAALASAAAACSAPAAAPDDRDEDVPTFVSLNPCTDAILVEVAAPEQILALSHYSRDPNASSMEVERAYEFGVTGGTAEEVFALNPDIVLASTFMQPATRAALEEMGLRIEVFGSPNNAIESIAQIDRIAALALKPEQGEALTTAISAQAPIGEDTGFTALLWQQGQIVAGGETMVAEHLDWAGFTNYTSARGLQQSDRVTLEQLMTDPPDILLVSGSDRGLVHPALAEQTKFLVADFDPQLIYCGGPTILKARERLAEIREQFRSQFWRGAHP